MADNCPDTRLVLGGYSLGAAVTDVVLAVPIAASASRTRCRHGVDQHIAAVALFGNGAAWVGPITNLQPDLLRTGPSSCATAPTRSAIRPTRTPGRTTGPPMLAPAYINAGMVNQAADFVAGRL